MKETIARDEAGRTVIASAFNQSTLAGYEGCALDYASSTAPRPASGEPAALQELLKAVEPGGRLLEIGSGPGWDADWLEARGLDVRRTDATDAFVRFQASRGRPAERLDVLHDPLGGPYDGILALYVFQHIERDALPAIFGKAALALREGGAFLLSIREGAGETVEQGSKGGAYYVAMWQRSDLLAELGAHGFGLAWSSSSEDGEGRWLTVLLRKSATQAA